MCFISDSSLLISLSMQNSFLPKHPFDLLPFLLLLHQYLLPFPSVYFKIQYTEFSPLRLPKSGRPVESPVSFKLISPDHLCHSLHNGTVLIIL